MTAYEDGQETWKTGMELLNEFVEKKNALEEEYTHKFWDAARKEGQNRRMAKAALESLEREVVRNSTNKQLGEALNLSGEALAVIIQEIDDLQQEILDKPFEEES